MPTKHVDKLIEAYLDNQLSVKAKAQVDQHLQECLICTERFYEAKRLRRELEPVLRVTLGKPTPPARLQQKVKNAVYEQPSSSWFRLSWTLPIQVFGAVGNMALVAALAFGALVVIRGHIPGANLFYSSTIEPQTSLGSAANIEVIATPFIIASRTANKSGFEPDTSGGGRNSLGDTVFIEPSSDVLHNVPTRSPEKITITTEEAYKEATYLHPEYVALPAPITNAPPIPEGTIAYAVYDVTPGIEAYRLYFISPDGNNLRTYPLRDVSEPALHPNLKNKYPLAVRTWEEKSNPRTILTSNFSSEEVTSVANYWEDAQADWSPIENRIIFASQRESDRNWRLYTAWGDGSREDNLHREGRSPTFAADGQRFAFESCDKFGNRCGLWLGYLYDNDEDGYQVLLENPLAKSPDWSPTDEKIVYMANPNNNWDLYLMDSDGSNVQRLTNDPAIDGLPAWSPDGEWVAFVSNRNDEWGLWILHLDSGTFHRTVVFDDGYLTPEDRRPYNEHGKRYWWDEQISWSSN